MKFKYIDYGENLVQNIKKDPSIIYVFSDYSLKNNQKKESKKDIFEPDSIYLTLEEFKDRIFKTDKTILNEAKRLLTFYNVMKKEFKTIKINHYFESIEFSNSFFTYYTELNRALCKNISELEPWQKKQFDIFEKFKIKYQEYLDGKNYLPKEWLEDIEYLDISEFNRYKKIVFVDIVNFSPLDKYIIKKLNESCEIEIIIQGERESFDEEKLELKEIVLPKEQKVKISYMEVQDEIELVGNLLDITRRKSSNLNIFSPEAKTNTYSKIFPNSFMRANFSTINDTKFFKFLETQNNLVLSIEPRLKNLIPISDFLEGIKKVEMIEYYNISKEDIEYIYQKIKNDYKYIGVEENETITKIYEDILKISQAKSMDFFIDYFNEILNLHIFIEDIYVDFYEKLQEYLGYAKTTEIMFEEKELKSCFKNGGEILKFLLQYLNGVEIVLNESSEGKILIKPIENCKVLNAVESIFINTSNKYLPKKIKNNLFLTEKQKKENGFMHYEKERREEKYRFYQALLKNSFNTLIYIKNSNTGEGISPILSEVKSKYELLKLEKKEMADDILEEICHLKSENIKFEKEKELKKHSEDFFDNELKIGPYDFNMMSSCEYRFYLNKICKLDIFESEEDIAISAKFLGNFVHKIFEKVTRKIWQNSRNSVHIGISFSEVEDIAIQLFKSNRKKFPVYLDNYFLEILIPKLVKNILKFYDTIEEDASNSFKAIESEKIVGKEFFLTSNFKVILSGRIDLFLKTEQDSYVIDFKTGKTTDNQLDFYSIALYDESDATRKIFYNAFEGESKEQEKIVLTKEQLKEKLEDFFITEDYSLSKSKSACSYCNYSKICRRDV